jgi:hypothetical protein
MPCGREGAARESDVSFPFRSLRRSRACSAGHLRPRRSDNVIIGITDTLRMLFHRTNDYRFCTCAAYSSGGGSARGTGGGSTPSLPPSLRSPCAAACTSATAGRPTMVAEAGRCGLIARSAFVYATLMRVCEAYKHRKCFPCLLSAF